MQIRFLRAAIMNGASARCVKKLAVRSRRALSIATTTDMHVELVYFDVHARGELARLCYAASEARGTTTFTFTDTRLPLMIESDENAKACADVHRPAAPFLFFPYLNVTPVGEATQQLSGDGVIEGFVAKHLDLLGSNDLEAAVITTIAHNAVALAEPELTSAGLRGDSAWILETIQPEAHIGTVFANLERYVSKIRNANAGEASISDSLGQLWTSPDRAFSEEFIVSGSLTLADLAIYNAVDECVLGPRGNQPQEGVEDAMRSLYPQLMDTYDVVSQDMADYITERQNRFLREDQVTQINKDCRLAL